MKTKLFSLVAVLVLLSPIAMAQETPTTLVDAYDAMADTILSLRKAEHGFVRAMLDGHLHAAKSRAKDGQWNKVAAQMALFASEGDNAIGGVRKKLLEGGHHFNAEGEEKGVFEPGFVIVTSEAKQQILALAAELRQAADDDAREEVFGNFKKLAKDLLEYE